MVKPVINTEKHIVQNSLLAVASGNITNLTLAKGLASPSGVTAVREGSIIKAIYLEYWITSDDTGPGTAIVTLEKVTGGQTVLMTAAQSAALNTYVNKKNVFNTFMGLIGGTAQYPMAAIRGWFKIPKGKQRFGLDDRLILNLHGQSNGLSVCGFSIYKENY